MAVMTDKQFYLVGGAAIVGTVLLVWGAKRLGKAAVDTTAGLLTGENELTAGTAYQGKGVVGTLAAGTDAISGGFFSDVGHELSDVLFDWFGPSYDPNAEPL